MRVLVVHGSKRGGTEGLADMVATSLRDRSIDADVRGAGSSPALDGYDAVIIGGGLYANRWHSAARRFVKRNTRALRSVPVYFFSSGPLDDSATEADIPPTPRVAKLIARVDGRDHVTFGGYLSPSAKGFPASAMAKQTAGDWRDPRHVDRWVQRVVADLQLAASDTSETPPDT